jgi:hypothetical protein
MNNRYDVSQAIKSIQELIAGIDDYDLEIDCDSRCYSYQSSITCKDIINARFIDVYNREMSAMLKICDDVLHYDIRRTNEEGIALRLSLTKLDTAMGRSTDAVILQQFCIVLGNLYKYESGYIN